MYITSYIVFVQCNWQFRNNISQVQTRRTSCFLKDVASILDFLTSETPARLALSKNEVIRSLMVSNNVVIMLVLLGFDKKYIHYIFRRSLGI